MSKLLAISSAAYAEIKERFAKCGEGERIQPDGRLNMEDVLIMRETDEDVKVYLVVQGQVVK